MGSGKVILPQRGEKQQFVVALLRDLQAMDRMIKENKFERDPIRIGAEQELCLIDSNWKPAMCNTEVLDLAKNDLYTTELAKFNLETNMAPLLFKGNCLSKMESDLLNSVTDLRRCASQLESDVIMTGILPTIRKYDMNIKNLTPYKRYKVLCEAIEKMREGLSPELNIDGIDELRMKHDSALLEGCNTGFQVHLQVTPDDFVQKYNIAQAIAGPALAVATNSPMLFGRRLWHETRIALFQQSIDVRVVGNNLRSKSPRVMFGTDWVRNSILDIYREDIMRFEVLLGSSVEEDPFEQLEMGNIPNLYALLIHNSTVYRWNRPCYGITNGVPHLRIENRCLPSGPTVKDEVANAAFWLGLLNGFDAHYQNLPQLMDFDDAKDNFFRACKNGINTKFQWFNNKQYDAADLVIQELIPIAKEGLKKAKVNDVDIDHYMDILTERAKTRRTGSQWMLNSYSKLIKKTSKEEARAAITASIVAQQKENIPVHEWKLASADDLEGWQPSALIVEDFMQTELVTVQEDAVIELVAEIMDWRTVRYVAVEDRKGNFVGLVTSRNINRFLLNHYYDGESRMIKNPETISAIMIKDPLTIKAEAGISEAIDLMQAHNIGCLPVVNGKELVGMITEQDYHKVIGRLTYRYFKTKKI